METVDGRPHVITNPVFIAEVLSPSTEGLDRGAKGLCGNNLFNRHLTLPDGRGSDARSEPRPSGSVRQVYFLTAPKSREYRATGSLRQYALISQEQPWVEIHTRDEAGFWRITEARGLEAECEFTGIDCRVPMTALYEGVLEQ